MTLLLLLALLARPLPDPTGTWDVYYSDNNTPAYTWHVYKIRQGWATEWRSAWYSGGMRSFGTMQQVPGGYLEYWHDKENQIYSRYRGRIYWQWSADSTGAIDNETGLNIRKRYP